jgi:hypothetical protein
MKKYITNMDRGILFMILAPFASALMGGVSKILSDSLSGLEITFFHNFFGVLLVGLSIYKSPLKQIELLVFHN